MINKKQNKTAKRRLLRWLVSTGLIVGLFTVLLATSFIWLNSDAGRGWLTKKITSAYTASGGKATIQAIEGNPLGAFSVLGVVLEDGDGAWLVVDEIKMDWRPLALVSGRVDIIHLQTENALLSHLPGNRTNEPAGGGWKPSSISINELAIRFRTSFGADAADQMLTYVLAGRDLVLSTQGIRLDASLKSIHSAGDSFRVSAEWTRDQNLLALDAALSGASGGVLEVLLGLGGKAPIEASLKGKGPISQWQGEIEFKLGSAWGFASRLAGKRENLLAIEGRIFYPQIEDQPWKSLLGVESSFSGSLGVAQILQPSLDVLFRLPGAELTLKGRLNPDRGGFVDGLDFAFTAPLVAIPLSEQESLEIFDLSASGTTTGGVKTPTVSGEYRFQAARNTRLDLQDTHGEFSLTPAPKTFSFHLAGTAQAFSWVLDEGLKLASSKAEWDLDGDLDLETRFFGMVLEQFTLDWLSIAGKGAFDQDFVPRSLDLAGTLDNQVLASPVKLPDLTGLTEFRARYARNANVDSSVLNLDVETTHFQTGLANVDLILGQQVLFKLSGESWPGGALALRQAELAGTNFKLGLVGAVSAAGALELDYTAAFKTLEGIAPQAITLEDGLDLTGSISGDYKNPSLAVNTGLDRANIWGLEIEQLQARLTLDSLFEHPHGAMLVGGQTDMGALNVQSTLAWQENGSIVFGQIAADVSSFLVTGNLVMLPEGGLRGKLEGSFGQQELVLAGQGLQGEGNISLGFDVPGSDQEITFLSSLQNLRARDANGLVSEIGQLSGTGKMVTADTLEGNLEFVLEAFYRDALVLDTITLSAELGRATVINIAGSGHYFEPLRFQFNSRSEAGLAGGNISELDFSAEYGGRVVRSSQPISLLLTKNTQRLDFPAIQVGDGSFAGFIHKTRETLTAQATADGLDMVFLTMPWQGSVAAGTVSGTIAFEDTAHSERLLVEIHAENLLWQDIPEFKEEPLSLNIKLNAHDGSLDSESILLRGGTQVGTFQTSFFYLREPVFEIDHGRPISAVIRWDGPVEPLWSLARLNEHELNGHLRGEIGITGSIDTPAFTGSIDLERGTYSYFASGLDLKDVAFSLAGDGDSLKIRAFEATDGQGGTLKAEGTFDISPRLFFPGKVEIIATDLTIVDLDGIKANGSGHLVYLRSDKVASLSGTVKTRRIEAELTQILPKSVVSIEVREINLPRWQNVERLNRTVNKRPPLGLDLSVEIPNHLVVQGRGLESEWRGNLSISGTADVPIINGTAELVRGYFDFGGKRFSLDTGRLFFDGGRDLDPGIELISRARTSTIDAEIKISGNLSFPQVGMSSVPVLPEDEILSQLLFGSSITELSPFQLAELASTLATISGKGGGINLLSAARKRSGLDILSISSDPDMENGTLLTGGKYLTKDVFLEVETATSTGEVVTRLFYAISKRLRAESEVSQKKGNSLKLKWFWDY